MLALPAKQGDKIDIVTPLTKSISTEFGPQVAQRLEPTLKLMEEYRESLLNIQGYLTDTKSLERIAMQSKLYLSMWFSVCQSFAFGDESGSIDLKFTWQDAYTKKKVTSSNPNSERLAILYNLGVIYNQMGNNIAGLTGNYKDAVEKFMIAAWVFDQLRTERSCYKSKELSVDLSDQNIHMCSYITKAEAQYCVNEHLRIANPDKYGLTAKVVIQASLYYGPAYSYASTYPLDKAVHKQNFAGVLLFNEHYYMAQAYYLAGLDYQKKYETESMGIGKAIAYMGKAMEILTRMKSQAKLMPPSVTSKCQSMLDECKSKQDYYIEKNNKIYHERVPATPEEIDPLLYSKPKSIENELVQPFDGQAIFARMVPKAVQELEEEFKNQAGAIVKQGFSIITSTDTYQTKFLEKHNLPVVLHITASEEELPEDLWQKAKMCKEKDNESGLKELLYYVSSLSVHNGSILDTVLAKLDQEEQQDKVLRAKYGPAWTRPPSEAINYKIKNQLLYYKDKYNKGKVVDAKLMAMTDKCKERFTILELDKAGIIDKVPKGKSSGKEMSPTALKLTELMKTLGELKGEADKYNEEMINCIASESVTNEMMKIYLKSKEKEKVSPNNIIDIRRTRR